MAGPYPFGGTIYDIAGVAVTDDTTTVLAINVTKSTSNNRVTTSDTTDPVDGSYAVDMANLQDETGTDVEYSDGDAIQLHVFDANGSYYAGERATINISEGPPSTTNIYLHPGSPHLGTCRLLGGFANNQSGAALYFDIYDIENDAKVCRVNVATVASAALPLSVVGREIPGGMCIVYSGTTQGISFVRSVK